MAVCATPTISLPGLDPNTHNVAGTRIISADSHVIEPYEIYTGGLHNKFGDQSPRMMEEYAGQQRVRDELGTLVHVVPRHAARRLCAARVELPKLERPASDYMRDRVWHGIVVNPFGDHAIPYVGASQVCWGSDFPHVRSIGTNAQVFVADLFKNFSREDQEMIVGGNTAGIYGVNYRSSLSRRERGGVRSGLTGRKLIRCCLLALRRRR